MDLLLNDFSLIGQYSDVNSFVKELRVNILPCLELAQDTELSFLLKSHAVCDLKVTSNKTVRSILKHKKNSFPEIALVLDKYGKAFLKGPFWEDNIISPQQPANCLDEAFYRNGILLSFIPNTEYDKDFVANLIQKKTEKIPNATTTNQLLKALDYTGIIKIECNFSLVGSNRVFMIHTGQSEDNHKEQHFHIKSENGTKKTTVSLKTFDLLVDKRFYAEQMDEFRKDIKLAKTEINQKKLKRLWNYLHPDKQI